MNTEEKKENLESLQEEDNTVETNSPQKRKATSKRVMVRLKKIWPILKKKK